METISSDMKDKKVIESNLHWFIKQKSCFNNLTTFYNEITGLVDERRAVNTVYLEFSKAFATSFHIILIDKLMKYGLRKWRVRSTECSTAAWCPAGGQWCTALIDTEADSVQH